jgi:hypothetical protein
MAKQLSKTGISEIKSNPKLFSTICELLGIKPGSLMSLINRNSERLNQHIVVMAVAESMSVEADDILEERELTTSV